MSKKRETKNRRPRLLNPQEALYAAWKAGERKPGNLAKKTHCSTQTVRKYIEFGLPANGLPAFKSRLQMEIQKEAEAREEERQASAQQTIDEYQKVRGENLAVLRALRAICTLQVQSLLGKLQKNRTTLQHIEVAGKLALMLVQISRTENYWLRDLSSRCATPKGLSTADIDYVITHEGELPPGMTGEEFLEKMSAAFGLKRTTP